MEKNLNLKQIQEFFSKPLEENTFKVGDKITYLGHPGEITATKEYNGRNFVSVSYDKGKGKTKASDILTTDGTVKAVAEGFKDYLGYSSVEVSRPTQDQVDRFFALTQNETHYLNSKPVAGQEKTFNKMEVEPWDEYDLSNWNSLVRKAKAKGKSLDEAKVDYDFSERELIRVLRQLKRNASTEIDMIKAFTKALGRDITKDELFSESIDEDQSYASTFGGSSKKLDGREIKIELKKRGYDTPSTGIWNKILVKKNGERMGMIDTDNSYYTKGGQMYKWRGTSNFIDHVESIAEGFKDYLGYSEKTSRVSMPRFVKDKNNPNFLNVYIDYDLGPGGSSIALGKETMTGQIRRESAAKAMKVAGNIARDLETKYNLEDIDIQDLENGKVRIFAVSDDFINMDPNMLGESLNESQKEEYDSLLDKEYDLTAAYTKDKTEANWKKLSDIRKKGKKLEKELEDQGLLHEEEDKIDIVTMDVPLFIRALEYAKEDAQEDMDLHDFAERAIAATKEQGILQMDDYDMLVGDKEPMNKLTVAEKVIAQLKEEKPGLWANIRAKKARGEKPAHGNSDASKSAKKAGKKINSLTEEEGVPHYTKDGKEWKGKVHKMPDNSLMSGNPHDKNGSGPNGKSEKLFHKEDLNEIEDNGPEEKEFDAELMAAANSIAVTLGKELKAKQGDEEQLDEAVVTSAIASVLTGNALIGFISKISKKLAKKLNWKKGEDFAGKVQKWAHDNEVAFQMPIKRILKFFIKDEAKLESTTKGIYAIIIIGMASSYGADAISSLSNASWFKAAIASLKGIAKGDEAIATAYPVVKSFIT